MDSIDTAAGMHEAPPLSCEACGELGAWKPDEAGTALCDFCESIVDGAVALIREAREKREPGA